MRLLKVEIFILNRKEQGEKGKKKTSILKLKICKQDKIIQILWFYELEIFYGFLLQIKKENQDLGLVQLLYNKILVIVRPIMFPQYNLLDL